MKHLLLFFCIFFIVSCTKQNTVAPKYTLHYKSDIADTLSIDFFVDDAINKKSKPLIIYFHGGSWISGTRLKIHERYREKVLCHLLNRGYIVASVDYSLIGLGRAHLENAVKDCALALSFFLQNSDSLNIDTSKIGFWGSSAGAHLAMMSAFSDSVSTKYIKFIIDDFGPVNINKMFGNVPKYVRFAISDRLFNIKDKNVDLFDSLTIIYSPINYNTNIPLIIFHGKDDNVVDISQSQALHSKFKDNSSLVSFKNNGHGFKNLDSIQLKDYINSLDNFLDTIK